MQRYIFHLSAAVALFVGATAVAVDFNAVNATAQEIATRDHFPIDADEKIKVTGKVVKVTGRTLLLDANGLQQEFHVMPNAKITRNLLEVKLKAILPGDKATITYVMTDATKKQVALAVQASSKR